MCALKLGAMARLAGVSPGCFPGPARDHGCVTEVWFAATGAGGACIELRRLGPEHLLDCLVAEITDGDLRTPERWGLSVPSDVEPSGPTDLGEFAGLMELSTPMLAVSDDETNPVWWVTPRDRAGHLGTLAYVVGLMEPRDRAGAIKAHLDVLADLVAHERAAQSLQEDWQDQGFEPRCVACWSESETHLLVLSESICDRARELGDAMALFPFEVSLVLPSPEDPGF